MTEYTREEQAEHRALWVAALRSGEYRQGRGKLTLATQDGYSHCCLGVACEVARANGVDLEVEPGPDGFSLFYGEPGEPFRDELYLPEPVREWLGLDSERGSLDPDVDLATEHRYFRYLSSLNDSAGYDFNQIADVIESGKVATQ